MIILKLFGKGKGISLIFSRSYFKTSPQAQSRRWIEVANPRNPAMGGITVVVLFDPLPLKVGDLRLALDLIVADPGLWAGKILKQLLGE